MKIGEDNFVRQMELKNEKALLYVIDHYGGILKSVISKHLYSLKNYQEECMNDVLLGIWNNIASFDQEQSSFKNWAAGVARYKAINYLRKYAKDLDRADWDTVMAIKEDESLTEAVTNEISEELEDMLSCLNPFDRELFMQLYVEEIALDEVSRNTGIKKEVIYNRISRGKKKIRNLTAREKGANII